MPDVAVIIPFHRGRSDLALVLAAVRVATRDAEVIVVANGTVEEVASLAHAYDARLLTLPTACGPAVARNRGAELTTAPILVFVDADVVVAPDAIRAMRMVLADSAVSGVFGAYTYAADDRTFFAPYRNLAHAFVHERSSSHAHTFWAGLGAIRASAFRAVGGFDERFGRPSVEDIDLGYRLTGAGYRLRLDPSIRGTHLKRWTFRSSVASDVRDRGVPWTQLILKYGATHSDLNVSWRDRLSVVCAYVLVIGLATITRAGTMVAGVALASFIALNWTFLRFFIAKRDRWFACRVLLFHLVHHFCNGLSLTIGIALWVAQRITGRRSAWTIPANVWRSGAS